MDFFPEPPEPPGSEDLDDPPQPAWLNAPKDVLAGVVPVELVLGHSESTAVMLTGMRAFPAGVEMVLGVRLRGNVRDFDLNSELFDGPYRHDMGAEWQVGRLKWGVEFADGRRATTVDPSAWTEMPREARDAVPAPTAFPWEPSSSPVLQGGGGGGGPRDADRSYWLWPLPPAVPLRIVCQWLARGIEQVTHEIDGRAITDAAARARPLWDGHRPESA